MVQRDGSDRPDPKVFGVKQLTETAWYVARTPGGVRGGGREAPLYSIGGAVPFSFKKESPDMNNVKGSAHIVRFGFFKPGQSV